MDVDSVRVLLDIEEVPPVLMDGYVLSVFHIILRWSMGVRYTIRPSAVYNDRYGQI